MKKYKPKFTDPRIQRRLNKALGFTCGFVSETESKTICAKLIDKHYGDYKDDLSKYLRHILLICTNHEYSTKKHKSKQYIMNRSGVEYLKYMRENSESTITWNQWNNNLCEIKNDEFEKETTVSHSIPLCSGSHKITEFSTEKDKQRISDKRLINLLIQKEFGLQLLTGNFDYNEKSNRLWHDLQSMKKENKIAVLSKYNYQHQYDINAAAPTLLLQYAKLNGFNKKIAAYEYYLDNKEKVRNQLAHESETSSKIIKVLINALFNGAKLGHNEQFAVSHLFDHDRAKIEFIKQHEFIIALRKDIKEVWDHISTTRRHQYKYDIDKTTGEILSQRKIQMTSKIKWGIYFELEYKVMQVIRSYMNSHNMKYFLEHDGWASDSKIDLNELSDYVREQTEFNLTFDYENLCEIKNDEFEKETTISHSIPLCSGSHKITEFPKTNKKQPLTKAEQNRRAYLKRKQKDENIKRNT